jgi:predicted phosphodiesterase
VRIAVFSDVHGNRLALEAVLAAIERERPQLILNLGDVASGAVDPRGTLDLLRARTDILTLRGNHERQLLELTEDEMGDADRIADAVLTDADRNWFAALPERLEPMDGVLAVHGAPGDDLRYLLETVEPTGLREATDEEVIERLGADTGRCRLYLCGHTHLQRARGLPDGALVVNPGSVGWPAFPNDDPFPHRIEAGTPHARYTTVTRSGNSWTVNAHLVEYDANRAALLAEQNSRADIAQALRTGRVCGAAA